MVGAPPRGALPRVWRKACSVRFPEKTIPAVRRRFSWGRSSNLDVPLGSSPEIGRIRPYKIVCDLPASRRRQASRGLCGNLPMNWVADIRGICTQAAAARGAGGHVGVLGAAPDPIAMGVRNVRFFFRCSPELVDTRFPLPDGLSEGTMKAIEACMRALGRRLAFCYSAHMCSIHWVLWLVLGGASYVAAVSAAQALRARP